MNILKKHNFVIVISLVLWTAITLVRVLNHTPWYDEAHAWIISQELNLFEIIKLMKIEGHTIIWYLVLMPFAKSNFMYPYPMLLLNWLFCFIAILILWLKSPFNNWIKFLISFSFPFFCLYPVIARCYAIGIMLLFAITAIDKDKLKHPNWYALLLILCANTSVVALFGATAFGVMFIAEQIKARKFYVFSFLIMLLGAIIVLVQLLNSPNNFIISSIQKMNLADYNSIFVYNNLYINWIILILLCTVLLNFYLRNKIFPTFLMISFLLMFHMMLRIYSGFMWHHYFLYVFFIISCWLIFQKYGEKRTLSICLAVISLLFVFNFPSPTDRVAIWGNKSKAISNVLLNDSRFENSKIVISNERYFSLLPYIKNSEIKMINYCSGQVLNYDTTSFVISDMCHDGTNRKQMKLTFDYIDKFYSDNLYFLVNYEIKIPKISLVKDNECMQFEKIMQFNKMNIYKVNKVKIRDKI